VIKLEARINFNDSKIILFTFKLFFLLDYF
jgi:hypothetical protein